MFVLIVQGKERFWICEIACDTKPFFKCFIQPVAYCSKKLIISCKLSTLFVLVFFSRFHVIHYDVENLDLCLGSLKHI